MVFQKDTLSRLYSMLGGVGTSEYDPLINTYVTTPPSYSRQDLSDAYRSIWACRKVCDFMPDAMGRGWGRLILKNNQKLESEVNKKLDETRRIYVAAQKQANLYGGATVVRMVSDGRDMELPIGDRFDTLAYSRVFNPWEMYPYIATTFDNIIDPEYYTATLLEEEIDIKVHSSRVIRFRGASTDYETQKRNRGFEDSLLIPFLEPCLRYLTALSYVGASVKSFEFLIHKIESLFETLQNNEGQNRLASRLKYLYNAVSSIRGAVIDKDEEDVVVVSRRYSGVSDVVAMLLNEMIAASGLTRPQLLQEHPSGLSATGESERLAEADRIRAMQEDKWGMIIQSDCELILKSFGYARDDWEWEWTNLFQQTPLEEAETLLKMAQVERMRSPQSEEPATDTQTLVPEESE